MDSCHHGRDATGGRSGKKLEPPEDDSTPTKGEARLGRAPKKLYSPEEIERSLCETYGMTLREVSLLNAYEKLVLLGWHRRPVLIVKRMTGPLDAIATVIE